MCFLKFRGYHCPELYYLVFLFAKDMSGTKLRGFFPCSWPVYFLKRTSWTYKKFLTFSDQVRKGGCSDQKVWVKYIVKNCLKEFVVIVLISFRYIMNSKGQMILPCGISISTFILSDLRGLLFSVTITFYFI